MPEVGRKDMKRGDQRHLRKDCIEIVTKKIKMDE